MLWLAGIAVLACGCASNQKQSKAEAGQSAAKTIDAANIQRATMNFAGRYVTAMAETYDRVREHASNPEPRTVALRLKIFAATGAMNDAVNRNPLVGLMDMALMVTLTRQVAEDPWVKEVFGADDATIIVAALKAQENEIWTIAADHLNSAQIEELHALAARWRQKNPNQRYVVGARLADFQEATKGDSALGQLATGVFSIVRLDPFAGLDPAVREVAESRLLVERMFSYLQGMGFVLSWQAEMWSSQVLSEPRMTKLFANANTVASNTPRFTDATKKLSEATTQFAQSVEGFRKQLPDQQGALVSQLDALVARQRESALQQATTQISVQRDAAIKQIDATVSAQQALLTRNLQGVTDASIDRLYVRVRSLVLIAVGAILAAFVIYRIFASAQSRTLRS